MTPLEYVFAVVGTLSAIALLVGLIRALYVKLAKPVIMKRRFIKLFGVSPVLPVTSHGGKMVQQALNTVFFSWYETRDQEFAKENAITKPYHDGTASGFVYIKTTQDITAFNQQHVKVNEICNRIANARPVAWYFGYFVPDAKRQPAANDGSQSRLDRISSGLPSYRNRR